MVDMGACFFAASGYSDICAYDAASLARTLESMLGDENAVLLVVEKDERLVGMAGALIYPFYFNQGHLTSQEMFWWVDEAHRGIGSQLFDALEENIRRRGAMSLSMIALDRLSPDRVGSFYERRGFRPSERMFIRRFSNGC